MNSDDDKKTQSEEIRDVIKNHLPEHVGSTLRARLEEADVMEAKVKELEDSLKYTREKNRELEALNTRKYELDGVETALNSERDAIEKEKADLKTAKLQVALDAANDKVTFMRDVTMGLVRNVEYRRSFSGTVPAGVKQDSNLNGCAQYGGPESVHVDNTTAEKAE